MRGGVIVEAENVPADRFDFRPTEEVRDVSGLLRHILEVSQMMVGELTREETRFGRLSSRELVEAHAADLRELRGKEELLEALETTREEGIARFRDAGELHMLQLVRRFDGQPGTRLAWLYHGISQEMYHRGQLTTYQRLMGLVPALTRRIRGEA